MREDEGQNDEGAENAQEEMAGLLASVKDIATYNLSLYAAQAWHHLGLVPLPGTATTAMDLDQARLAIDLYEANMTVLLPHLEKDAERQLKRTLMDLQLNFVNKSKAK